MVTIDRVLVRLDPGTNGDPRIRGYADATLAGAITVKSMRITMHRRTGKISVHPPNKRLTVPCPRCGFGVGPRDHFCCACGVPLDRDEAGDRYPYADIVGFDRELYRRLELAVLEEFARMLEAAAVPLRRAQ